MASLEKSARIFYNMPMPRNIVYFDLETQRTSNDAGGWDCKQNMGMSLAVTYSTASGEYRIYGEKRVNALVEELLKADLVIGYNILHFDYEVLMGYTILDLKHHIPTLDMLVEIEKKLGHRLALDALAKATIGAGKSGDGMEAIKWWREGRLLEIAEYCCIDVKVTRMLHEYGCKNKELFYNDRFAQRRRVEIEWN